VKSAPGPAADVFAFGVLAYEVLGASAFAAPPIFDALSDRAPTRAASLDAAVSEAIREVIQAAVSIEPGARPTAAALCAAFDGADQASARRAS
jgi:hypothetical protein